MLLHNSFHMEGAGVSTKKNSSTWEERGSFHFKKYGGLSKLLPIFYICYFTPPIKRLIVSNKSLEVNNHSR